MRRILRYAFTLSRCASIRIKPHLWSSVTADSAAKLLAYQSDELNLYAYVHNNPVNATDPSGTQGMTISRTWDWARATGSHGLHSLGVGLRRGAGAARQAVTVAGDTTKEAMVSLGQGISYAVSATGEVFAKVGSKAVEGVELAALETFNQGLNLAGATPDQFFQVIDHLGDVAKPLITRGRKLVGNLLGGVRQGFEQFFGNRWPN